MHFSFANVFFPSKFPQIRNVCQDLSSASRAKTCYCFLKSVKQKSNFLQIFEWLKISRGKTNKPYDTSAAQNDPGYNTKKSVNLILKNGMLKAIYIYIYIERERERKLIC